jgi:AraC-like DNA-binding protein
LIIGRVSVEAHIYERDAARIQHDNFNHYQLNLHLKGGYAGRLGRRETIAGPGDLSLFDFSQPMIIDAHASEMIIVALPRDVLERKLLMGDHHGLILAGSSALGGLLTDHLCAMNTRLNTMTAREASAAAQATCSMIAACFHPTTTPFATTRDEPLIYRIQRYISENVKNTNLDAMHLCEVFHLSRATLYRALEPVGGVSKYLREQRLSQIFTILLNPLENHRRISQIAYEWGFPNEAHFSRSFRDAFGISPRHARSLQKIEVNGDNIQLRLAHLHRR